MIDLEYWNKKILSLKPEEFEQLCYDLVDSMKPIEIEWCKGPSDKGRDIRAKFIVPLPGDSNNIEEWNFECKRYSKSLEVGDLHDKIAWADANKPDTLVIISNEHLSNSSREWISKIKDDKKYKILKWDGIEFFKRFLKIPTLVERYFPESQVPIQNSNNIKPSNIFDVHIQIPKELYEEIEKEILKIENLEENLKLNKTINLITSLIIENPKIDSRVKSFLYEQFALLFYSKNLYEDSFKYIQLTLRETPKNKFLLLNKANILIKQKKIKFAISILNDVEKLDKEDCNCLNLLGHCYSEIGNEEKAIEFFEKAISVNPNFIIARDNLGSVYRANSEYLKADEIFNDTLKIKKGSVSTLNQKARLLMDLEGHKEAIGILKNILKENVRYSDAWNNLGIAYEHLRDKNLSDLQEAVNCFKKVTIYDPKNVFGWTNLATTSAALKKFDEADKIMEKVIKEFSYESRTWQSMAIIEIYRKDLNNALKHINKSLTIDSKSKMSVMSHLIKAEICLNKRLVGQAKKSIEEAIKIKPDSIRAWELKISLVDNSQKQKINEKILEILKEFEEFKKIILKSIVV